MASPLSTFENGRRQAEVNLRCAGLDSFELILANEKTRYFSFWRVCAVAAEPDASGARRAYFRGPTGGTMDAAMINFLDATTHLVAEAQAVELARLEASGTKLKGGDGATVDRTAFRCLPEFASSGPSSGKMKAGDDLPPKYDHGAEVKMPNEK